MNDNDLFIVIKALLWYLPIAQMPLDAEIKKFIAFLKEKENENKSVY